MCTTKKNEEKLKTVERKIVRKIFGPKRIGDEFRNYKTQCLNTWAVALAIYVTHVPGSHTYSFRVSTCKSHTSPLPFNLHFIYKWKHKLSEPSKYLHHQYSQRCFILLKQTTRFLYFLGTIGGDGKIASRNYIAPYNMLNTAGNNLTRRMSYFNHLQYVSAVIMSVGFLKFIETCAVTMDFVFITKLSWIIPQTHDDGWRLTMPTVNCVVIFLHKL